MEKISIRRPDFNKTYPNEASFDKIKEEIKGLPKKMSKHSEKLNLKDGFETFSNFKISSIRASSHRNLEYFNSRRFNDYLLNSVSSKIVPSVNGRIENLLITVPSQRDKQGSFVVSPRHKRHYQALIAGLGDNRIYTVVCHPDIRSEIESWFSNSGHLNVKIDFVFSPKFDYSIWAQDAYASVYDNTGQSYLTEGVLFPRYDDMTIADDVAAQSSVAVLQSYLYFQGGNILGSDEYTLIGQDYVWKNTGRIHLESEQKVLDSFAKLFGTKIINVGGYNSGAYQWYKDGILSGYGFQPIFHIDMYITPTGVIGDSGKEIIMFGRPSKAKEITGKWSEDPNYDNNKYDQFFDETELKLSQYFEVKHLPLMLTVGQLGGYASRKKHYNLSFNNVVLENDGIDRNVVMTTYSQDANDFQTVEGIRQDLEQASKEIWENVGFNVRLMDGMEDLAYGDGSIHCITKALKRGEMVSEQNTA